jgi:transcriptional regulator with XRE-family HTH domain
MADDAEPNAENDRVPHHLGQNIRNLRAARGSTQVQMARAAGIPRATWANLETGSANPTLAVLLRVASALRVTLEELLAAPRSHARLHRAGTLPTRRPGGALVQKLLPDPIPGIEIERIELAPGQRMIGVPHTPGTREYLTCEAGQLDLTVNGEHWRLTPGDVLTFRGDQRHSYANAGEATAVGYSTILLAPAFA